VGQLSGTDRQRRALAWPPAKAESPEGGFEDGRGRPVRVGSIVRESHLDGPISDQQGRLAGAGVPLGTCHITICTASWLARPTLWYYSARANGDTRRLSLEEHASAETRETYLEAAARG
jgi:hypothetical protein